MFEVSKLVYFKLTNLLLISDSFSEKFGSHLSMSAGLSMGKYCGRNKRDGSLKKYWKNCVCYWLRYIIVLIFYCAEESALQFNMYSSFVNDLNVQVYNESI